MNATEPRFDAYYSTVCDVADLLSNGIAEALGATHLDGRKPRNGYAHAVGVFRGDELLCDVMHGGFNPLPFVAATGQSTPEVVGVLRERFPEHSVARADACVDLDGGPGTWDLLYPQVSDFAEGARLTWLDLKSSGEVGSDHKPATFYIGSPNSPVRSRTYAKGLEMIASGVKLEGTGYTPHTVRHEVQVRPRSRAKALLSTVSPKELLGANAWSQRLSERILGLSTGKLSVGSVHSPNDLEARLEHLRRMYGRTLRDLLAREGSEVAAASVLFADLA